MTSPRPPSWSAALTTLFVYVLFSRAHGLAASAAGGGKQHRVGGMGSSATDVIITADVPWVVQPAFPSSAAVDLAVRDLSHDWYKVLGVQPLILAAMPAKWHGGPIIVFDTDDGLAPEQFTVSVSQPDAAGFTAVHVTGGPSDRGAIYALYHFSEAVLGVDPWWWYYDLGPSYVGNVSLGAGYSYDSGVPAFERRGWFVNDEDMTNGFFHDPLGQADFTVSSFDKMIQTLLRLRGNTIIVGTTGFPDEPTFAMAARRGLMIAEHHMTPLGLNVWGWPTGLPYSYRLAPDLFKKAWTSLVDYQQDRDMLWSVGFRGLWDEPFWQVDPAVATDKERGQMIQDVLGNQTTIIESVTGKVGKYFIYMWSQMLDLLEKGFLKVPDDVTIVWADGGTGIIKGKEMVQKGQGLYYHVMMMDDVANQLTEAVPPHRIYREIGYMFHKGAVNYTIINVSDVRPVPLSLEAIMKFLWNPVPYVSVSPWDAQRAFLTDWCSRHIGAEAAPELADVYGRYFNISYMANGSAPLRYGERYLATWGQELAQMFQGAINGTAPITLTFVTRAVKFVDGPLAYTRDLLYNRTLPLQPRIPAAGLPMFLGHTVLQVAIHYHGLSTLSELAGAMLAWLKGDKATAVAGVQAAIGHIDSILARERDGEGTGRWQGLFQYDQFDDFGWSRQLFLSTLRSLQGEVAAVVPNPPFYADLFGYECARFSEVGCTYFPFMFNQSFPAGDGANAGALTTAVRATCEDDVDPPTEAAAAAAAHRGTADTAAWDQGSLGPATQRDHRYPTSALRRLEARAGSVAAAAHGAADVCVNTWTGGLYAAGQSALVRLATAAPPELAALLDIRYTVNSTAPTATSTLYTQPFRVSGGNTTVRAGAFWKVPEDANTASRSLVRANASGEPASPVTTVEFNVPSESSRGK